MQIHQLVFRSALVELYTCILLRVVHIRIDFFSYFSFPGLHHARIIYISAAIYVIYY
jgi:hypothetical protein